MERKIENPLGALLFNVALSLLISLLGFFVGIFFIPPELARTLSIVFVVTIVVLSIASYFIFKNRRSTRFPIWIVYLYAFIEGIILYPIIAVYLKEIGVTVVVGIFIGTILWVLLLALIALKSKQKFLNIGFALLIGLIIEAVLIIFGIFFFSDLVITLISAFGVLIFSGYVLYDISLVKLAIEQDLIHDRDDLSIYVLNVYIDIVAIFIRLLRIVSYFTDRD